MGSWSADDCDGCLAMLIQKSLFDDRRTWRVQRRHSCAIDHTTSNHQVGNIPRVDAITQDDHPESRCTDPDSDPVGDPRMPWHPKVARPSTPTDRTGMSLIGCSTLATPDRNMRGTRNTRRIVKSLPPSCATRPRTLPTFRSSLFNTNAYSGSTC